MKKMNNKGFSLIELIIVIAIMAILVAIIAPNLTKYLRSSKEETDKKNIDEVIAQVGSVDVLIVITTLQSLSYAIILGIIGKILAKKIGVWRNVTFNKKGNIELIFVTLVGGAAFILLDVLIFGNFSEAIKDSYAIKPTFEYIIASVTYGAVIEEIILRLFFMSLIAFIIQKIAKK